MKIKRKRLSIFRSNKYFYVQLIDDDKQRTIFSLSTLKQKKQLTKSNLLPFAEEIFKKMKEFGIDTIVFDKGNIRYKHNVSILADTLRDYGVIF